MLQSVKGSRGCLKAHILAQVATAYPEAALTLNGIGCSVLSFLDRLHILQFPLDEITWGFMNTPAGLMAAQNTPTYMYPVTKQTVLDSRAQQLQGFNAYRAAFGLRKFKR